MNAVCVPEDRIRRSAMHVLPPRSQIGQIQIKDGGSTGELVVGGRSVRWWVVSSELAIDLVLAEIGDAEWKVSQSHFRVNA